MSTGKIELDMSALKGRIKEKYDTYENIVPHLSYGITSLSQKLNGRVFFSIPDMLELAEVLEIEDKEFSKYFFKEKVRKHKQ